MTKPKRLFRSSNKWDTAKDILANEYNLHVMSCFKRKKRIYRYEHNWYTDMNSSYCFYCIAITTQTTGKEEGLLRQEENVLVLA